MLQSNVYEPSAQHRLLLLLDGRTFLESWLGVDPELQELTISAAASIACWGLDEGYLVGLAANGITPSTLNSGETHQRSFVTHIRVPMARGSRQQTMILGALGQMVTYFSIPMSRVVEAERATLPYGTTVVFVGTITTLQEETVQGLLALRKQGAIVHLVLTGASESTLRIETADLLIHQLGGREVWHDLLQAFSTAETGESSAHLHIH